MIAIICTLLSGVGFYFSLMLGDQWWLAWIAPIPVLWFAYRGSKGWIAFAVAFFAMALGNLNAVPAYGGVMPPVVLGLILAGPSLIFAAAVMLSRRVMHAISPTAGVFAFAALWTTFDYLVSFAHDGAIASPANSQVLMPLMIQSASLFGIFAITFLLGIFSAGIAMTLATRSVAPAAIAITLLAANVAFGAWRMNEAQGPSVRVGLGVSDVRMNARTKATADKVVSDYAAAARKLAAQGATLIVFPEKVATLTPAWRDEVLGTMQRTADDTQATIVIGFEEEQNDEKWNAAPVFTPHHPLRTYIKRHFVTGLEEGYTPGKGPFVLPDKTGVDICKDMDYPRMQRSDAQSTHVTLLAAPAWDFDKDRVYHARPALMRGVEEGFALARSAKQGLLTLTDTDGRMIAMNRSVDTGMVTVIGDLPRGPGITLYQRIGDVFVWLCILLGLGLVGFSFVRKPD
ncbi:MAG TPA: nitrilase-related carbon-nitrogen hydrolase [Rhizomicrobium sp.]|nr:nitrilase-related carbon-nitrogen hydrolase [Rhizomicrobium sp.]